MPVLCKYRINIIPEEQYFVPIGVATQEAVEGAVLVAVLVRDVEHVTRKYRLLK
jgi:hypothetical protein